MNTERTNRLNVRMSDEEYRSLSVLAEDMALDLSSTVRHLIREKYLERGITDLRKSGKKKRRDPGA